MPDATIPQTPQGWPYLDDANFIDVIPDYTEQLAIKLDNADADVAAAINAAQEAQDALDQVIALAGAQVAAGTALIYANAGAIGTGVITFPSGRFTAAPRVTATLRGTPAVGIGSCTLFVNNVTASGFEVRLANNGTTNFSSVAFDWIALQVA